MSSLRSRVHRQRTLLVGLVFTGWFLVSVGYSAPGGSGQGGLAQKLSAREVSPDDAAAAATSSREAFERGRQLFDAARTYQGERPADRAEFSERYRQAAEAFVAAWRAGAESTEVFTNAANCYAFAGLVGRAVLYYRRALAVDPNNRRARDGLEFLRASLPVRRAASTSTSLLRTLFFWHDGLAFRTRRLLFFALFPAGFLFFTVAQWRRRPFFWVGVTCILPGLALLGSLLTDALSGSLARDGVLQVEIEGRRGDGATYGPSHSMPLPAGTEVTAIAEARGSGNDSGAAWVHVRLLDGSESWIPASAMERVLVEEERGPGVIPGS